MDSADFGSRDMERRYLVIKSSNVCSSRNKHSLFVYGWSDMDFADNWRQLMGSHSILTIIVDILSCRDRGKWKCFAWFSVCWEY